MVRQRFHTPRTVGSNPTSAISPNQQRKNGMKYLYHYHAIWQNASGEVVHADGTSSCDRRITTADHYTRFKEGVAKACEVSLEQLTICSITLL